MPRRVKAYHATSPEAFRSISRMGAIIPTAMRADDESIRRSCETDQERLIESGVTPVVIEAIRELIDEYLVRRSPLYRQPVDPDEIHSPCLEIISGWGEYVFLSTEYFINDRLTPFTGQWGFVFDGLELIENGAGVILDPFEYEALYATWESLYVTQKKKFPTIEEAKEALLASISKAKEGKEIFGQKAWRRTSIEGSYIFWSGPLPIDWAIEIWKAGEKMRPKERSNR